MKRPSELIMGSMKNWLIIHLWVAFMINNYDYKSWNPIIMIITGICFVLLNSFIYRNNFKQGPK